MPRQIGRSQAKKSVPIGAALPYQADGSALSDLSPRTQAVKCTLESVSDTLRCLPRSRSDIKFRDRNA